MEWVKKVLQRNSNKGKKQKKAAKEKKVYNQDGKAFPDANVITIGPQPMYKTNGKAISCDLCDGAAVYPMVVVCGMDVQIPLCLTHHPKYKSPA